MSTLVTASAVDNVRPQHQARTKCGLSTLEKTNVYTRVYGSVDTKNRSNSVTFCPVYTVYTQNRKLQEKGCSGDSMGSTVDTVDTPFTGQPEPHEF